MKIIVAIFLIIIGSNCSAQFFNNQREWQRREKEYTIGGGVSFYNGDLGGLNKDGTPWFIFDIDLPLFKYGFWGNYRTNRSFKWATSFTAYYGRVMGSDALTSSPGRRNRNLHFRSQIIEIGYRYEWHFLRVEPGHLYNLKGARGKQANRWGGYLFFGVAGFYFNPKSSAAGGWTALRPLGTEGQGLPGRRKTKYFYAAASIPVGFSMTYNFSKSLKLGIEPNYRFTSTDYLDDVSRKYYDNQKLAQARGGQAAYLADPNLGMFPNTTRHDARRGNPKRRDAYLTGMITLTYMPGPRSVNPRGKKHSFMKGAGRI